MLEIIVAVVISGFLGWLGGFLSFLVRYKRHERCYLCDTLVEIKELIACDECDAYSRTLSDKNLVNELCKITKRLTEVDVYKLNGMLNTWKGDERYEEINETIVCGDNFIDIFRKITEHYDDSSINIKIQFAGTGEPKKEYNVT